MTAEVDLTIIGRLTDALRANINRFVVTRPETVDLSLVALLCNGHILIEDVPGVGKTTLAKCLAYSLGSSFKRIQFTPDLTPTDVLGTSVFNQNTREFEFRPGPIFTQLLLADEINRATPRTQSALLEAMQERQVTVDGVTMQLERPFLVIATQNSVEMEGTFPLPEAQIDRFMLRVTLGYPSEQDEKSILSRFNRETALEAEVEPVVSVNELINTQASISKIRVEESIEDYAVKIVRSTRAHPGLDLGASPRATVYLYRAAQAIAAINGREYVLPDDIKSLASPVLAHRLLLSPQSRLRGLTTDRVIQEVLASIPVPVS